MAEPGVWAHEEKGAGGAEGLQGLRTRLCRQGRALERLSPPASCGCPCHLLLQALWALLPPVHLLSFILGLNRLQTLRKSRAG